jgi:hypothetical protein
MRVSPYLRLKATDIVACPDDPATVKDARTYRLTVPVTAIRSPTMVVLSTLLNVIRSAKVELSVECWTFTVIAPFRVFAVTWA